MADILAIAILVGIVCMLAFWCIVLVALAIVGVSHIKGKSHDRLQRPGGRA